MKKLFTLGFIGVLAGIALAGFLKVIQLITGNQAYVLLFEVDYVPVLQDLSPVSVIQFSFHFGACIFSVIALYFVLQMFHWEKTVTAYMAFIIIGSSILYLLTMLSPNTPKVTDIVALGYWVIGHGIFSVIVGVFVKKWV